MWVFLAFRGDFKVIKWINVRRNVVARRCFLLIWNNSSWIVAYSYKNMTFLLLQTDVRRTACCSALADNRTYNFSPKTRICGKHLTGFNGRRSEPIFRKHSSLSLAPRKSLNKSASVTVFWPAPQKKLTGLNLLIKVHWFPLNDKPGKKVLLRKEQRM